MQDDSTSSIFRSAKKFFSGTVISRFTGMVRDMAMAYAFGTQGAVAGFMVAFRLSHLMRRILGEGALQTAFIPCFEELRREDPGRARLFFRSLTFALPLLLLAVIAAASLLLGGLLVYGDLDAGNREIVRLTLLLMPGLFFICLYGLNSSLLQCQKSYFTPSIAPVAFNLVWILGVLALSGLPIEKAMAPLALFVVAASLAQWLATLPRSGRALRELGPSADRSLWKEDLKRLYRPLTLSVIGIAASQINNALDALFARYADPQGPALLWYAIRLQQLPLSLFGIALSGALLPPLARAMKKGDRQRFLLFLRYALGQAAAVILPLSIALIAAAPACINLLFGRGDFTEASTLATVPCLWAYSFGLLPTALILILAPAFYAEGNYRLPTTATSIAVLLNILLNALFTMGLGMGAASVALATSLSAWMNAAILWKSLDRKTGGIIDAPLLALALKTVLASASGLLLLLAADSAFGSGSTSLQLFLGMTPSLPRSLSGQLAAFGIEAAAFGAAVLPFWLFSLKKSGSQD